MDNNKNVPVLQVENLTKHFPVRGGKLVHAVDNVSFSIPKGKTMGLVGLVVTYVYVNFVCRKLFPAYKEQQFLAMYGMLTGTASTGVILLREIDGDFKTPVADNLVYQNFPAMVFGFPILILATMAPTQPYLTLGIVAVFMAVMNILLFRSFLFREKAK